MKGIPVMVETEEHLNVSFHEKIFLQEALDVQLENSILRG